MLYLLRKEQKITSFEFNQEFLLEIAENFQVFFHFYLPSLHFKFHFFCEIQYHFFLFFV